jgi:large subunit ribosomal protein L15
MLGFTFVLPNLQIYSLSTIHYSLFTKMRLIDLKPKAGSKHRKRRIGRGIAAGQGASGGFGMRGQKSRSGFEGGQMPLYRRLPKLKHFPLINQKEYTVINVRRLCELPANSEVTLKSLMTAGIVTTNDGPLKLLGDGDLTVALNCKAAAFTTGARAKIEAAGGTCEVI